MEQDAVRKKMEEESLDKDELKKNLRKKLLQEEEDTEGLAKNINELGLGTGGG